MTTPYLPTGIQNSDLPTSGVESPLPTAFDNPDAWFMTLYIECNSPAPRCFGEWLADAAGTQVNTSVYYVRGLHRWLTREFHDLNPLAPWGVVDHQDADTLLPTVTPSGSSSLFSPYPPNYADVNTGWSAAVSPNPNPDSPAYPVDMNILHGPHWDTIGEQIGEYSVNPGGTKNFSETKSDQFDFQASLSTMAAYLLAIDMHAIWANPATADIQGLHIFNRWDGQGGLGGNIDPSTIVGLTGGPGIGALPFYDGQIHPYLSDGGASSYISPSGPFSPAIGILPGGVRKRSINAIQMGSSASQTVIDSRCQVMAMQLTHYIIAERTDASVDGGTLIVTWRQVAEGIQSGGTILEIGGTSFIYGFPATISGPTGTAVVGNSEVCYIWGYQTLADFVAAQGAGNYLITHY